ncbi:glycosyltransferase family 2 protein [Spirillospora sp. CA-294931]|uniref:glycosyltransferase family 2 protein n=1 Tax=Spirillospora sp. CA-294931 TaxID=3240042 RepID=UPI003D919836
MRTAAITIAAGRHAHLRRQREGLAHGVRRPDHHLVVAMGDPRIAEIHPRPDVLDLDVTGPLPLARARNLGARRALDLGAELLIFLDVDCIPGPTLVERYRQVADRALLCGTVAYLPPSPPGGYKLKNLDALARPHPSRPAPAAGEIDRHGDHRLFWSLSFAVTAPTWRAIGGFDDRYTGYGGEDTDFGQRARANGVPLWWVGGAPAYHQHHAVSTPPVEHLDDILRNAERFHRRWGWWPMRGWLEAFEAQGLVHYDHHRGRWARTSRPPRARASASRR